MNILVCAAQVPFARGGAEMLAEGLVSALQRAGHRAEIVALPFQWQPHTALFKSALAWRLLDLRTANGIPVDRIIATKFPSVRGTASDQSGLARASIPAGVRLVRHPLFGIYRVGARPHDARAIVYAGPPRAG